MVSHLELLFEITIATPLANSQETNVWSKVHIFVWYWLKETLIAFVMKDKKHEQKHQKPLVQTTKNNRIRMAKIMQISLN